MKRQVVSGTEDRLLHLRNLCADVSNLLKGPLPLESDKKLDNIEASLEDTLTRIDEFQAFISSIQSNRKETEQKLIPQLVARTSQIENIFSQIDKLETFIKLLEDSATKMEDRVRQVDGAFGENKLKSFLGSLLRNNADTRGNGKAFQWKQGDIVVRHKEYFE
mmetsp:Transcript_6256/g.10380  ORF Transcript_6256/g.10380 Transcript_6256/m.10380 type:complete len:163 (-) Transcript_6256:158-646(-)